MTNSSALPADDVINGEAGDDDIYGAAGNDYIDGGAGDDIICAGDGCDTFFVYDEEDSVIDGGSGHDVLRVFNDIVELVDVCAVSLEEICLASETSTQLLTTAADVMDIASNNSFIVTGNAEAFVTLEGAWSMGESSEGFTYFYDGDTAVGIDNHIVAEGHVTIVA